MLTQREIDNIVTPIQTVIDELVRRIEVLETPKEPIVNKKVDKAAK